MPIESEEEQRWKYWVPQPLSREAMEAAPETIRTLKIRNYLGFRIVAKSVSFSL